jgi:hypothetical protein
VRLPPGFTAPDDNKISAGNIRKIICIYINITSQLLIVKAIIVVIKHGGFTGSKKSIIVSNEENAIYFFIETNIIKFPCKIFVYKYGRKVVAKNCRLYSASLKISHRF